MTRIIQPQNLPVDINRAIRTIIHGSTESEDAMVDDNPDHKQLTLEHIQQYPHTGELCLTNTEHPWHRSRSLVSLVQAPKAVTIACQHAVYDEDSAVTSYVAIPQQLFAQKKAHSTKDCTATATSHT